MSFPALSWAVRQKLPGIQKLVLLMLSERHNKDTGQCNPSLELLAEDCGLSRRSVIDQIAKLQAAGYLTVIHRAKENQRLPSQYVLHLGFGVRETEKTNSDDPYLLPKNGANKVHQGSECPAPGVVNDVHQGSECPAPGVVNDVHQGSAPRAHRTRNRTCNVEPGIEPQNPRARKTDEKQIPEKTVETPEKPKTESPSDDGLVCRSETPFDRFWAAYPKKVGKDAARRAWNRLKKPHDILDEILQTLAWQRESEQWTKDHGQFIPNPATYLNQGRWMDERPVTSTGPPGNRRRYEKFDAADYMRGNDGYGNPRQNIIDITDFVVNEKLEIQRKDTS